MKMFITFSVFIIILAKNLNAQRFEMNVNINANQKYEIHGIILDLVENDSLEFINEFSSEQPDIMIPLCREWDGYFVVPIGDFITKLYIISWVKGMQNFIDYLGGMFREIKIYETKSFQIIVMSHKSSNNNSYLTFDKKYKDSVVIFAKKLLGETFKYSQNFLMINMDSSGVLYRRSSDPVYSVAPFYNCRALLKNTAFHEEYHFDGKPILKMAGSEDPGFHLNFENDEHRLVHVTRLIKYGKWDISFENNEITVSGKDLNNAKECIKKVKVSTCKYFYIDYLFIYEWECIFRLVKIKPITPIAYPCTIEITALDRYDDETKVEFLVPFDYPHEPQP